MKKLATLLAVLLIAAFALTACSSAEEAASTAPEASAEAETSAEADATDAAAEASQGSSTSADDNVIRVGASPTPHGEILAEIKDALEQDGYTLEVVEFTDYIQPNVALTGGDLDANYFQHITYMNNYNDENGTDMVSAAGIHYEPFAIYSENITSLDELEDGAQIAVPNDPTNEARALLLLQEQGLITLSEDAGLDATKLDIAENPKNIELVEIEAAQLPRSLPDVAAAVINGNYALEAGLSAQSDAIATENSTSDAAQAYTNVIAVVSGNEDSPKIQALLKALETDDVKAFIDENYKGNVVAVF
ncbi:MAG: ABC transporter substrate-binding protein [Clostridia bacterium]|nr:ABC transporter substrate-binding protein [Clostridia bacterium]